MPGMSVKMKGADGGEGGGAGSTDASPSCPPSGGVLRQSYIASEFISMNLHSKGE